MDLQVKIVGVNAGFKDFPLKLLNNRERQLSNRPPPFKVEKYLSTCTGSKNIVNLAYK